MIRVAIPSKGRLREAVLDVLDGAGYQTSGLAGAAASTEAGDVGFIETTDRDGQGPVISPVHGIGRRRVRAGDYVPPRRGSAVRSLALAISDQGVSSVTPRRSLVEPEVSASRSTSAQAASRTSSARDGVE